MQIGIIQVAELSGKISIGVNHLIVSIRFQVAQCRKRGKPDASFVKANGLSNVLAISKTNLSIALLRVIGAID